MTTRHLALGLLLITLAGCVPIRSGEVINVRRVSVRSGDDPAWADPALDDSGWEEMRLGEVPEPAGVLWLRAEIEIRPRHRTEGRPLGLFFTALASHEIFWDGELLGRGGRPAALAANEVPGPIEAQYVVPERLAATGSHVVAIRTSAHHRNFSPSVGYWGVLIGEYDVLLLAGNWLSLISSISLSGMVMVALFALALFLAERGDRSYLLLSALCLVAAALLVAESWKSVFGYTYDWHLARLIAVTALTALFNLLLLLFLAVRFPNRGWRVLLGLAVVGFGAALLAPGWDGKAMLMHAIGLVLGLAWTLRSWSLRRRPAVLASTGLATALALFWWEPARYADLTFYFALDFLLVCLLASHAWTIRRIRREREEALVRSARLEIELLKKHIRPHYLMNTLTALSEWIEQEPGVAAEMIQSLSEEFRLLAEISDRKLIRMEDELRLCRSHLDIMSRRKGCEYVLRAEGVDPDLMVPPALFHTLVENGVTHGPADGGRVEIGLRAEAGNGERRYVVEAPLEGGDLQSERIEEGTGLRYVRARLDEAFGDRWKMDSGPRGDVWRTVLTIDD